MGPQREEGTVQSEYEDYAKKEVGSEGFRDEIIGFGNYNKVSYNEAS